MAKYVAISEENEKLFYEVLDETTIPQWVEIKVLGCEKQKEIYKISKASDILEVLTEGINFVVVINEGIFDQLTDEQQKMVLIECLAGVSFDSEKDVISLAKHDFTTHSGVLQRFGHEEIITLKESIKSLYDAKKEEEDRIKAERKSKRGK